MPKTIMIVDDSASMRNLLSTTLKSAGYEVFEGCDGVDAISKLTGQKVHLIVTDLNMPNMDGLTFLTEVKKLPAFQFTPIIMLTTEISEAKKEKAKVAGAKAWVVKPFQPEQLLNAVSKLVTP